MVARGLIAPVRKIEFGLLGPLEVSTTIGRFRLGRPSSARCWRCCCSRERGRLERPADRRAVGGGAASSGREGVQVPVSGLRKPLEPERDRREPMRARHPAPGYELRVEPTELDPTRFEPLVAEARGAARPVTCRRRGKLCEALALWRGRRSPISPMSRSPRRRSPASRSCASAALEDRIAADLELGRHADLVARARGAGRRASPARAPPRPADARALPLRPPGRGARGLPGGAPRP